MITDDVANGHITITATGWHNNGTVRAAANASTITINSNDASWTNNGTVIASNGGTVDGYQPSNLTGTRLMGGSWQVFADSTLTLNNADIQTNAATVVLDGANSHFYRYGTTTDALANLSTNTGTLTVGDTSTFTVGQPVTNSGTINLQTGATLSLAANVTTTGASGIFNWTEGSLTGSNATALIFTSGGQLSLSGAGQKTLQGPEVTVQNASTATWTGSGPVMIVSGSGSKFTNAGGHFLIQGDANFVGDGVFENMMGGMVVKWQSDGTTLFGSNVEFRNNASTVEIETGELQLPNYTDTGNLMLNNGTLTFGSDVTVNTLTWAGGTLKNTGKTTINGAGLMISGSAEKVLDGGTLANGAASTWTGSGPILLRNGAVFSNEDTLDSQGDVAISWIGGALSSFQNNGTFVKSPASGTTTLVNVPFTNTGTVDVEGGTLFLSSVFGNFANQTLTGGTYQVSGTLQFIGAQIQTNAANIILDGPNAAIKDENGSDALAGFATNLGQFTIQNGAVFTLSGAVNSSGSLTLGPGGTLTGSDTLTSTGIFNWTGGTMAGTGMTMVAGGGQMLISGSNTKFGVGHQICNGGTIIWDGTGGIWLGGGSYIDNEAGATFMAVNDAAFVASDATTPLFDNEGAFFKSSPDGGLTTVGAGFDFHNGGTVEVDSGMLDFAGSSLDNFNVANGTLTGGTVIVVGTLQFTGASNFLTNDATLVLDGRGPGQIVNENSANGLANFALNDVNGSLTLQHGYTLVTGGGFTNLGYLLLDFTSTLNVSGDYTQGSNATLEIELGGIGLAGQVNITANANLDGTLALTPVNGYTPTTGDAFTILTFASRNGTDFANPPAGFSEVFDDVNGTLTVVAQ
jgi:hypothetical protein